MLISAEIAELDPNFRNCPQYRKSQLFLNCLFADPSLTGTDVNSETNVSETSEGNAIRNAIYDLLWNNHQRNLNV